MSRPREWSAWYCKGEALSSLSATELQPWSHRVITTYMYTHMCNQLHNCNRTKEFPKAAAKRKHFVINNPCSQESHPFSTRSVSWRPRVTIEMVPFQQLLSDKIYYLLAWNMDSSQVTLLSGMPSSANWGGLGAWASHSHRCLELIHFSALAF